MEKGPVQVTGALAGRYTIERELGRGEMATVYLARDEKLARQVALKILDRELGTGPGSQRFLREMEVTSGLSHPNILTFHDWGCSDGRLFYVMPFVEGECLSERLVREGQLAVEEAVRITKGVAGALGYAHGRGVVHGDIKPENILLGRSSEGGPPVVLVADFGLARALDGAGEERLTESDVVLGTAAYMSPEQAAGSRKPDGRSDIYALGCVIYEMLVGAPPFTGPSIQAILARHATDPVPALRTVRPTVPRSLEAVVERALAKAPGDRFQTAKEFADALEPKRRAKWPFPHPPAARRRTLLLVVVGAALLGSGTTLLRRPALPAVTPVASTIAVLPFLPTEEGDTALHRLGQDLAITVSASLDGLGEIKTADRLRLIAEMPVVATLSVDQAAALARRLGSASLLRGSLSRERENVRVELALYDSRSLAPLVEGVTQTGRAEDLGALTDSVVWALLQQVWRRGEAPSPSLVEATTVSVPALRAFLDGERHIERGEWRSAALAFRSAIASDTAFWLAHYRYVLAQSWIEEDIETAILARLDRNKSHLPEREQMMVRALNEMNGPLLREMELYRDIIRRYPDHWPAWFHYGDALFHEGPLLGYTWKEAQRVFARAVVLNPKLKPGYWHMFWNSVGKDTAEARRAFDLFQWLPGSDPLVDPREESADLQLMRLISALDRSGGAIEAGDTALADSVARFYLARDTLELLRHGRAVSLLWAWNPVGQIAFNRRMLQQTNDEILASPGYASTAYAWAERGAWDSALAAMLKSARSEPHFRDYGLAVLGAWLGTIPTEEASKRRPRAIAWVSGLEAGERQGWAREILTWLDGLLGFARRDHHALERARERAGRSVHPDAGVIERSLAAFGRALAGDRAGAGRDLLALERQCAASHWERCGRAVAPNIAVHRLAAATWLLEAGDTTAAAGLLTWMEARPAFAGTWTWSFIARPLAYLMLARIEETRGDAASAEEHYRQFLRHYDSPMPKQRHLVEEARSALRRLEGRNEAEAQ